MQGYRSESLRDPSPGDKITTELVRTQNEILRRGFQFPDSAVDSIGARAVVRRAPSSSSGSLYWCMLQSDHPGKDQCFNILVGEWDPATNGWTFDCSSTEFEKGVDFHNGAPLPEKYACGWFERKVSETTDSGYIYLVVSLDCTARESCGDQRATGCGET